MLRVKGIDMELTQEEMASAVVVSAMSEEDDGGAVLLWMKHKISREERILGGYNVTWCGPSG